MDPSAVSSGQAPSIDKSLAELIDELSARLEKGAAVDLTACAEEHPAHAEELRRLLPALQMLADLSRSGVAGRRIPADDPCDEPGDLGDFRIGREIGRGGMGVVYEAEQLSLRRRVALKVLPFASTLDSKQLQRFKNEAQAAACLHHTNIVPVFATGCERGVHYYAMQFIEGGTLAALIAELRCLNGIDGTNLGDSNQVVGAAEDVSATRSWDAWNRKPSQGSIEEPKSEAGTRFSASTTVHAAAAHRCTERSTRMDLAYFRTVANLGAQAAEALDYAHAMGVVHRDIKPANLLVDTHRNLWIADFGLAQVKNDANLTLTGDLVGTLRYMSPEQSLAKRVPVDHRTDIYSLGMTLYELLTLQPAFIGTDRLELLRKIARDEPRRLRSLNRSIPAELETVILKAIDKSPANRYETAHELGEDLRRFLAGRPVLARPVGPLERSWRWCRRNPAISSLLASIAVLLAFVGAGSVLASLLIARKEDERKWTLVRTDSVLRSHRWDMIRAKLDLISEWFTDSESISPATKAIRTQIPLDTGVRDRLRRAMLEQTLRESDAYVAVPLLPGLEVSLRLESDAHALVAFACADIERPAKGLPHLERAMAIHDFFDTLDIRGTAAWEKYLLRLSRVKDRVHLIDFRERAGAVESIEMALAETEYLLSGTVGADNEKQALEGIRRALLGRRGKFEDGERLLLVRHAAITRTDIRAPEFLYGERIVTIRRLVSLYTSWGKSDEAKRWANQLARNSSPVSRVVDP